MKKSFHVFFLFVLFAFFAVNTAWAACPEPLQKDADTDECFVNMPATGTSTVSITADDIANGLTSFKVYDDGGKDGKFSSDANGYLLLTVPEGYKLAVSGNILTNRTGVLTIYDGNSEEAAKILQLHGMENIDTKEISSGNELLFYFRFSAGDYVVTSGFEFTVWILKMEVDLVDDGEGGLFVNMPIAGTSTLNLENYIDNGVTSFVVYDDGGKDGNFSSNANGYLLLTVPEGYKLAVSGNIVTTSSGVLTVYDGNSEESTRILQLHRTETIITKKISSGNELLFYFRSSSTVASGFEFTVLILKTEVDLVDDGEGGLFVNMPIVGTSTLNLENYIASGVTSFRLYDDGGKDKNYSQGANGTLVLTAPTGYTFLITGAVNVYDNGTWLKAHDNENTTLLYVSGDNLNVYRRSGGNVVEFNLSASDDYDTDSGIDLIMTIIAPQGVIVHNADGGSVATDKTTAEEGTTVTLTATPKEGFLLEYIGVQDSDGKNVAVNGGFFTDNIATFTMPAGAVVVKPVWTNNWTAGGEDSLFVNMPKSGKIERNIPVGVQSFKLYDDGGKFKTYSDNVNQTMQLTAPEGYVFQVSGYVHTESGGDKLTIYDGTEDATKLVNAESGDIQLLTGTTSGNVITFYFSSNDYYTNMSGFDLKVTLVKPTYGAVSIAKADDGKIHATINGDYAGKDALDISEAIEVDAVDYNRELEVDVPVTALLPVTLPAGTTVNAEFYTLEKVEQVEGMKWQATMKYIGDGNLPQPNTPYAVILPKGQSELKFDLPSGKKATVQTGDINKVCGVDASCKLDENGKITDDWFFTGTYAYKEWKEDDEELGLAYAFSANDNPGGAAKGKFGKIKIDENSSEYPRAKAMRCYLRKRDANVKLQQQNQAQMVAASPYVAKFSINNLPETIDVEFVKDDAKGGRTVLHGRMNTVTGEFKMLRDYDLKGRKVNSTNWARGAYYGKKVMKK